MNVASVFNNGSVLPGVSLKTNKRIKNIEISSSNLYRIIKDLNPNKAHGHDNRDSIIPPLKIIFESAIRSSHFPDAWKKGNIIPVHKKESKNLVKNYRPISLLPIFGKILEKIIYNNLFESSRRINSFLTINLVSVVVILVFHN